MKLDTNNHSVFLLNYHLILCIKYRRKVITNTISEYAKGVFERIGENYHITVSEWNHDNDHIHVLFKAHPNTELSKFVNAYKSASSRLIKKDFPAVTEQLWKEYFWSKSYCLVTVGGAPLEVLKTYIENQGKEEKTR
ncbi:IS200/IS605 family transposase [Cohnella nanjingensis]|uniref:IS200/IS605 family transposase n=1 Tax=Cohnella nanjingensis TaxID=1387779 RepID=A0A7X0RL36_9BACL|nr:IS200/IS605 family transposase [Cohnella nanjingensis]MBB6669440.1 IS200/IS605 family transposase [Cohnella nanjingensis]